MTKTYPDKAVHLCAPGRRYEFTIYRRRASAGKEVMTFCPRCSKTFTIRAGIPKDDPLSEQSEAREVLREAHASLPTLREKLK